MTFLVKKSEIDAEFKKEEIRLKSEEMLQQKEKKIT